MLLLFPGQGCQRLGMCAHMLAMPSVLKVLSRAEEALGESIRKLITTGPVERLDQTSTAQPVIVACSVAAYQVYKEESREDVEKAMVGHSLGEFSCLVCSNALDIEHAVQLVHRRGMLMQEACKAWGRTPAMVAMHGLKLEQALKFVNDCPADLTCEIACSNGERQVVFSGCLQGVQWAVQRAKQAVPTCRGIKLPVSAPFHTSVMRPAAEEFAKELAGFRIRRPTTPIVFNSRARALSEEAEIKQALVDGITARVQWMECLREVAAISAVGGLTAVEIGTRALSKFGFPIGISPLEESRRWSFFYHTPPLTDTT
jgi:[acyl-carrier-protein] S-malonyltransferase